MKDDEGDSVVEDLVGEETSGAEEDQAAEAALILEVVWVEEAVSEVEVEDLLQVNMGLDETICYLSLRVGNRVHAL